MASVGVYPQADPETLESKMNDPTFVEWFKLLQKMVDEGMARAEAERYSGDDEMVAGNAAFTTASSSSLGYFPKNEDGTYGIDWKVISLPHAEGRNRPAPCTARTSWPSRKTTPQRDLAKWLFIKYWTSYDAVKKWVIGTDEIRGSSYMPLQRSMVERLRLPGVHGQGAALWRGGRYLETGVIEPQLAGQQAVRDILEDAYIKIINGEDVQATLDEATGSADEAFQLKGGQ